MIEQMDLFSLKYVRGSKTSLEAAIEAEPNAGTQRWLVLDVLREAKVHVELGLTDHQMQERLGMNPSTQRPRRVELVKAGRGEESGQFRLTPSGRRAVVWVAV